jgi:sugar/nucleoside kinase (ribokinase family)
MKMSILVVGSVAFDDLETPAGSQTRVLGGSATHFSVSTSFFTQAKLVGVVGGDFDDKHVHFLKSKGVCVDGLEVVSEGKTFHWTGRYSDDFNTAETVRTDLNVFEHFQPKLPDHYKTEEHVFLANIQPGLQIDVLDQVTIKPKWVACDTMNLWITNCCNELKNVLKRVDIFLINEGEAKLLTEESNVVRAAKAILKMGPKILVIKRGEYGSILFYGDDIFTAPAYPLESITDTTGAGDSFAGGFLGHLSQADNLDLPTLKKAMICGSTMASFQVEDFGLDRMRTLDYSHIQERYNSFQQLAHFHGHLE